MITPIPTEITKPSSHYDRGTKVAASGLYLITGMGLLSLGLFGASASLYQGSHFLKSDLDTPQGFGEPFGQLCTKASITLGFEQEEACLDLSERGWQHIKGPDGTVMAISIFVAGLSSTAFLSSFLIMGGISLVGKSAVTFKEAVS